MLIRNTHALLNSCHVRARYRRGVQPMCGSDLLFLQHDLVDAGLTSAHSREIIKRTFAALTDQLKTERAAAVRAFSEQVRRARICGVS